MLLKPFGVTNSFARQHSNLFTALAFLLAIASTGSICGCSGSGTPASSGGSTAPSTPTLASGIHSLTQVNSAANTGYFEDPLPIHLAQTAGSYLPPISGTTAETLSCATLSVGCYTASTLSVTTGAGLRSLLPANVTIGGYQNNNVYQDNAGNWQMATTVTVNNAAANPNGRPWNVILHASPVSGSATSSAGVPLTWSSDTLLVGSLTNRVDANYDGKFIEDNGNLYLIYSQNLQTSPTTQDGIVAQLMVSATQPSSTGPTTLLAPQNNSDGGYNSELFDCQSSTDQFKLIETGNISVVDGKYAMAYSTGSYETPCYKVGIAWSDSLLGPYKKVLQQDTNNVWNNPRPEPEVLYLIQALQPAWPNYVASTVQGPGVPSLVQYPAGTWYLYFAGYDPSVPLNSGMFNPKLRQPYVMRLNVAVPSGATVESTEGTELASWITAATT